MAIVLGSGQNDTLNGTSGDDTLDGGAGNDTINAGSGNDVLIYRYGQNIGVNDIYNGDAGNDTLRLIFTQSELNQLAGLYSNGSVNAYTAALQSYASTHTSLGNYSPSNFGFNLTTSSIENLQIITLSSTLPLVAATDSGFNVLQGSPLTINPGDLVANDLSVTGDNLGIIGIANATHGSLSIVNNQIVFTAAANYTGAASFTYTLNDQHGNIAIGTVSLNVSSNVTTQNEAGYNLFKNGTLAINAGDLVLNDASITGDHLGITGVWGATHGSFSIANGQIIFTGAANYTGVASFNYTVTDQHGNSATATVYLNVGDLIAHNDNGYTVLEGNSLAINAGDLVLNDQSMMGGPLGIIGVGGATHGSFSIANGQIIFSAAANYTGAASFFYTLADQHGNVAIATVNLNVVADLGPHAADDTISNQSLGVNSFGLPFSGQFSLLNNDTGQGITLVPPSAPFLSSSGYATISWDSVNNLMIYTPHTVNDADYATNTLAQLALGDHGTDSFTYTIKDMNGNTSTATVHIDVVGINDAPFLDIDHNFIPDANPDQTIAYEVNNLALGQTSVTLTQAELLSNFSDVDIVRSTGQHEQLTATINIANQSLPPSVTITDNLDGTYTVSWDSNYNGGNIDISYAVNDPHTNIGNQVFGILDIVPNINPNPNHAPVGVADGIVGSTNENVPLTISAATLLANDTDVDHASTLSIASVSGDSHFALDQNGDVVFTPGSDFDYLNVGESTTATFNYVVKDEHGALGNSVTASITVNGTNDLPVGVADGIIGSTNENVPLTISAATLLANDTDVDHASTLSIASVSGDSHFALDQNGNVVFTPGSDFDYLNVGESATATFNYVVKDEHGALGNSVTASITVNGTNDLPVGVADGIIGSTDENAPLTISAATLLANDTDVDHASTLSIASVSGDSHFALDQNGDVVFTPGSDFDYLNSGESATATFNYVVKDEHGALGNSVTASITVNGTNDLPVGVADGIIGSTNENAPLTISAATLLANDTDVDHASTLSIASVSGDSHFALDQNGDVVFTPGSDFDYLNVGESTTATFNYVVKDEHGALGNSVTASITVNGTNDLPVGVADGIIGSTNENAPLTISAATLLANDTDVDHASTLSIASVSGDSHFALDQNGDVVFTPGSDFDYLNVGESATATFNYVVKDEHGALGNSVTASITVNGTNDLPVGVADGIIGSTNENAPLTISAATLLANDTDVDNNHILSIASVSGDSHFALDQNGDVVFTPGSDFDYLNVGESTTATFNYVVKDEHGALGNSVTASITVNGTNDLPVGVADGIVGSTDESAPLTISAATLLANDTDVDHASTLSIASVSGDSHFALDQNGDVVFTPGSDFDYLNSGESATATFNYVVKDEHGALGNSVAASITINGVSNNAPISFGNAYVGDANDTNEDSAITMSSVTSFLLSPDYVSDPDGDALSVLSVVGTDGVTRVSGNLITGLSTYGASITWDSVSNTILYDPTQALQLQQLSKNSSVIDSFTYTVSDGHGGTLVQTAQLIVEGRNDAPVAGADSASTNADYTPVVIDVLANDSDVDSDVNSDKSQLTIENDATSLNGAVIGAVFVGNEIQLTYDWHNVDAYKALAAGVSGGIDTFSYHLVDQWGAVSNTATVSVHVVGINDAPEILLTANNHGANDPGAIALNIASVGDINILDYVKDIDTGSTVTFQPGSITSSRDVNITITNNGTTLHYDSYNNGDVNSLNAYKSLTANQSWTDFVSYTVIDDQGATTQGRFEITVQGVNDAPEIFQSAFTVNMNEDGTSFPLTEAGIINSVATDPENDVMSLVRSNPSDPLSALTLVDPTQGHFEFTNNTYIFHPTADFNGVVAYHFQITDGDKTTAVQTAYFNVQAVNDAPVAHDDTWNGAPAIVGAATNFGTDFVLSNDTDVDGDSLTVTNVSNSVRGVTVTLEIDAGSGKQVFHYDPTNLQSQTQAQTDFLARLAQGENALDSVTYTVSDGHGGTSTATFSFNIQGVNDAPVASDDVKTYSEADGNQTFNVSTLISNDTDIDNNDVVSFYGLGNNTNAITPTLSVVSDLGITVNFNTATHEITYNQGSAFQYLGVNETATDHFSYVIHDANGGAATATVTVNIQGVNDVPVGVDDGANDSLTVPVGQSLAIDVLANDSDPDRNDVLSITSLKNTALDQFFVSDNGVPISVDQGKVIYDLSSYDAGGLFQQLAQGESLIDHFTYLVSDGHTTSTPVTVAVKVLGINDAPVAHNDLLSFGEDIGNFTANNLLTNDTDIDHGATKSFFGLGNVLDPGGVGVTSTQSTVTVGGVDRYGDVTVTYDSASGVINFDANHIFQELAAGEFAIQTFNYVMQDEWGAQSTATVTLQIFGSNDAPVAEADDLTASPITANLNSNSVIITSDGYSFLANDFDPDHGDTANLALDWSSLNGPTANGGTISFSGGAVTYTNTALIGLAAGQTLTDSFTYQIFDTHNVTSTATVTFTVAGVNEAPTAVDEKESDGNAIYIAIDSDNNIYFTDATGHITSAGSQTISFANLLNNDTDPDTGNGDPNHPADQLNLSINSLLSPDSSGQSAALAISADGKAVTYTVANFQDYASLGAGEKALWIGNISDRFSYTVTDNHGGISGYAQAEIVIFGVNDDPIAGVHNYNTNANVPLNIIADNYFNPQSLVFGATDVDTNDFQKLHITDVTSSIAGVSIHLNTVDVLGSDGQIHTYVTSFDYDASQSAQVIALDASHILIDTLSYTLVDEHGGIASGKANVTIQGVNDAPVATNGAATINEDTTLDLTTLVAGLTSDVDGDSIALNISNVTNLIGGAVSVVGGHVIFTPTLNYNGAASFDYKVNDGQLDSAVKHVDLTITPVNDAPIANNDIISNSITINQPFLINASDLLLNDSDVDNAHSSLTIANVSNPLHGTVSLANGVITFTPEQNYFGSAGFSYTTSDGSLLSQTPATVAIDVGVAPIANDDRVDILLDANYQGAGLLIRATPDGVAMTDSQGNALTNPQTGLPYTEADGSPILSQPIGLIGYLFQNLLLNDSDADNAQSPGIDKYFFDQVVATVGHGNIFGAYNFNGIYGLQYQIGGSLPYTDLQALGLGQTLTDTFTYTLMDSHGKESAPATVSVVFHGANDNPYSNSNLFYSTDANQSLTIDASDYTNPDSLVYWYNNNGGQVSDIDNNDFHNLHIANLVSDGLVTGPFGSVITDINGNPILLPYTLVTDGNGDITSIQLNAENLDMVRQLQSPSGPYNPDFPNTQLVAKFTYTVNDTHGGSSAPVDLYITINGVDDPPVAVTDTFNNAQFAVPYVIDISTLLANDYDYDNNDITFTGISNPLHGTAVWDQVNNQVIFTIDNTYDGTAGFQYTISSNNGTATATGTVKVELPNNADYDQDGVPNALDGYPFDPALAASISKTTSNNYDLHSANPQQTEQVVTQVNAHGDILSIVTTDISDYDQDGVADNTSITTATNTYSVNGVEHQTIDSDYDGDGVIDNREFNYTTYNADGKVTQIATGEDDNLDGVFDVSEQKNKQVNIYDANHNIQQSNYYNNGDFTHPYQVKDYAYDPAHPNLLLTLTISQDSNKDGVFETQDITTSQYSNGVLFHQDEAISNNGILRIHNTYDYSNGILVDKLEEHIGNSTDSLSSQRYTAYFADGNHIDYYYDNEYSQPGVLVYAEYGDYDTHNNLIYQTFNTDTDGDGSADTSGYSSYSYTYDGNDVLSVDFYDAPDGNVSRHTITTNTYDTNHNLLTQLYVIDLNLDGIEDDGDRVTSLTKTYDAQNNLLTSNAIGNSNDVNDYYYDNAGRALLHTETFSALTANINGTITIDITNYLHTTANVVAALTVEDSDGNSVIDTQHYTQTFYDNGHISQLIDNYDNNGDGITDSSTLTTFSNYDVQGPAGTILAAQIIAATDNNLDGIVDSQIVTTNSSTYVNNVLVTTNQTGTDTDLNGTADSNVTVITNTYQDSAHPDHLTSTTTTVDGLLTSQSNYTYNYDVGDGHLVSSTQTIDDNGNGFYEQSVANTYGVNGQLALSITTIDSNENGIIDSTDSQITKAFDSHGNITQNMVRTDTNNDHVFDASDVAHVVDTTYVYQNNLVLSSHSVAYNDDDHVITSQSSSVYKYNANGSLVGSITTNDTNNDGVTDSVIMNGQAYAGTDSAVAVQHFTLTYGGGDFGTMNVVDTNVVGDPNLVHQLI